MKMKNKENDINVITNQMKIMRKDLLGSFK